MALAALVVLALGVAHIERTTRDEGQFASNSSLDGAAGGTCPSSRPGQCVQLAALLSAGVVKHGVDGGFMYEGYDERRHDMEAAEAI